MKTKDIKDTIYRMRATEKEKKELLKQCLDRSPHALFAVYGLSKRQTK